MLKILRIYFYFIDYYTTFQKKEQKTSVTEQILSQEARFNPTPIGFMRNSIKSSGMPISVVLMMPFY